MKIFEYLPRYADLTIRGQNIEICFNVNIYNKKMIVAAKNKDN